MDTESDVGRRGKCYTRGDLETHHNATEDSYSNTQTIDHNYHTALTIIFLFNITIFFLFMYL